MIVLLLHIFNLVVKDTYKERPKYNMRVIIAKEKLMLSIKVLSFLFSELIL